MDIIDETKKILGDTFGMNVKQAKLIKEITDENDLSNFLELGFAHGVSSCYMGSMLREKGKGHLVTIDRLDAKKRKPNIEQLLTKLDLNDWVTPFYENKSYTWKLMEFIEETDEPIFDFCYIDGAHDWYNDGFAFYLVDKLLKPGSIIIFDDYYWTYDSSPTLKNNKFVKKMTKKQRSIPHIKQVFDLLVKTHPDYHNFQIIDGWAIAQKKK